MSIHTCVWICTNARAESGTEPFQNTHPHKNLELHAAVNVLSDVPWNARCHPYEPFMLLLISSPQSDCSLYAKPQRFVDFVLIQLNKSRIESSVGCACLHWISAGFRLLTLELTSGIIIHSCDN